MVVDKRSLMLRLGWGLAVFLLVGLIVYGSVLWWSNRQQQVLVAFNALYQAVQQNEEDAQDVIQEQISYLRETLPGSSYTALASLVSAKYYFDQGDLESARLNLLWLLDQGEDKHSDFSFLTRMRLAWVLVEQSKLDEALPLLVVNPDWSSRQKARALALQGDIMHLQGNLESAKVAYQNALQHFQVEVAESEASLVRRFRTFEQFLLERLLYLGEQV